MVKKAHEQDGNDTQTGHYSHHYAQMSDPDNQSSEVSYKNVSYFPTSIPTSSVLRVYCIVIASL